MNDLLSSMFSGSFSSSNINDDNDDDMNKNAEDLRSFLNGNGFSKDKHQLLPNDRSHDGKETMITKNSSSDNNNDNNNNLKPSAVSNPSLTTNSLPLSIRLLKYIPYCPHCTVPEENERAAAVGGGGRFESHPHQNGHSMFSRLRSNSSSWEQSCHEITSTVATTTTLAAASSTSSSAAVGGEGTAKNEDDEHNAHHQIAKASAPPGMLMDYDLPALRRQNPPSLMAASPLVVAPMMIPTFSTSSSSDQQRMVEQILSDYIACCQFYCNNNVNAGVLTTLRFCLPSLRVSGGIFGDADMLALAELLLKYGNTYLRYIKRLDFSQTTSAYSSSHSSAGSSNRSGGKGGGGFRSHGAFALSKVLQQSSHIAEVYLPRNRIGPYGASAIFIACSGNPTVKKLNLRRCRIGERGALTFCDYVVAASSSECGLTEVDLSANYIGFKGIIAIENAMTKRSERREQHDLAVNLEGNLVLQEIMNGVTHGLGVLLAFLGSYLLSKRVQGMSHRHVVSCMVYSTSLIVLYMSSTLYHSFFTMLHTRYIFAVIDKCAIYILIAGSYTPFLQVVLWQEPRYSTYLLGFIWVCCFLGIYVEAFMPGWKQKGRFSLAMYLGMGWSAAVCLPEVARVVPEGALNLMVLGGVGYTAGVPFFVRDNNLDHAVWHLFVLGGSFFHWCGIYFYVAQQP